MAQMTELIEEDSKSISDSDDECKENKMNNKRQKEESLAGSVEKCMESEP